MPSIKDNQGYNQGFKPSNALAKRTQRRADTILENLNAEEGMRILEIGCGTGEMAHLLAAKTKASVLATDVCAEFIGRASENHCLPNLEFKIMDFKKAFDNAENQYDFIVGNGILHHFYYEIDSALVKIFSLLKAGGKMVFWEPNILNPYCFLIFNVPVLRKMACLEPGENALKKAFMQKKLLDAGFKNVSVEYRDFLLPNIPDILVKPVMLLGDMLEKIPVLKLVSQSLFICAAKQ